MQNVIQYGIQNIFVVDSASYRKTYPNVATKEFRYLRHTWYMPNQQGKVGLFSDWCCEETKLEPCLSPYSIVNSTWLIEFNVKVISIRDWLGKFLRKNYLVGEGHSRHKRNGRNHKGK